MVRQMNRGKQAVWILAGAGIVTLATAIAAAIGVGSQDGPADYTQWRGKNRDGAASGFSAPASWPETLTRRWKVEVGPGYATPLVAGNRVYVFTRRGDDEVMMSLDVGTGDAIWQTAYPAPYVAGKPAGAHGVGPKATPTLHDGKLFTLGISGIVAAFDAASGKLLWRTSSPSEPPYFSAASSPAADGPLVLVHPGNYGPLTALDASTGVVKWTAGDGGFFASPIIATIAGRRQAITVTQTNVIGVALPEGNVLWQHPWSGRAGGTMPVLSGDLVIVSGLDRGVAAFTPTNRDGHWMVEPRWETKDVSMYLSNPVLVGDTLFGLSHRASGQYFALDTRNGATLWRSEPRQATNSAVVKAGEWLLLLNDDAELLVARSSRSAFDVIRRYIVADSATWAQPAISGNRVFIKDVSSLTLWTFD